MKRHPLIAILSLAFVLVLPFPAGEARPEKQYYDVNRNDSVVTRLKNLGGEDCYKEKASARGRIIRREFDDSETRVVAFVVEYLDGTREHVYIGIDTGALIMADASNINRALQIFRKEGNSVDLLVKRCGAAGRIVEAEEISPVKAR